MFHENASKHVQMCHVLVVRSNLKMTLVSSGASANQDWLQVPPLLSLSCVFCVIYVGFLSLLEPTAFHTPSLHLFKATGCCDVLDPQQSQTVPPQEEALPQ